MTSKPVLPEIIEQTEQSIVENAHKIPQGPFRSSELKDYDLSKHLIEASHDTLLFYFLVKPCFVKTVNGTFLLDSRERKVVTIPIGYYIVPIKEPFILSRNDFLLGFDNGQFVFSSFPIDSPRFVLRPSVKINPSSFYAKLVKMCIEHFYFDDLMEVFSKFNSIARNVTQDKDIDFFLYEILYNTIRPKLSLLKETSENFLILNIEYNYANSSCTDSEALCHNLLERVEKLEESVSKMQEFYSSLAYSLQTLQIGQD